MGDPLPPVEPSYKRHMKRSVKLVSDADNVIRLPFHFCIQCGTEKRLDTYSFKEIENNPVTEFAKLAGDVSIILEYAINKTHKVEAKFCGRCISQFQKVTKMQSMLVLIGLIGIFLGVVSSTILHSYAEIPLSIIPFALSVVFLVATRIYSRFYKWRNSPNVTKLNKRKIILKVPGHGKLVCER